MIRRFPATFHMWPIFCHVVLRTYFHSVVFMMMNDCWNRKIFFWSLFTAFWGHSSLSPVIIFFILIILRDFFLEKISDKNNQEGSQMVNITFSSSQKIKLSAKFKWNIIKSAFLRFLLFYFCFRKFWRLQKIISGKYFILFQNFEILKLLNFSWRHQNFQQLEVDLWVFDLYKFLTQFYILSCCYRWEHRLISRHLSRFAV